MFGAPSASKVCGKRDGPHYTSVRCQSLRPTWERSGNGWGTLQTDTDPVFLCLTGDNGRCRNAGEDRPFLHASTVAEPIRGLARLELSRHATGHRPGSAATRGIGPSGPNERALLPCGNEPAQQASGCQGGHRTPGR
jgi:hypothetical protein